MHPRARLGLPGGENAVASGVSAQRAESGTEHARVGSESGAKDQRPREQEDEADDPLHRLERRRRRDPFGMDRSNRVASLPRRGEHGEDAEAHERRHHGIRNVPAVRMRQQQGHGTGGDGGDSVAPLVGGGHRPLLRRLGHLDSPRVDGDVLRRRRKANQHGKQRDPAKALRRIGTGNEPEPEDDERLADQHPARRCPSHL